MAKALPWYREAIPEFIMQLEQEIKSEAAKGSTWLPWTNYAAKMRCQDDLVLTTYHS
jgi:hypothetical protein